MDVKKKFWQVSENKQSPISWRIFPCDVWWTWHPMMFDIWWARTITSILFLNGFQGNLKCFINTGKDLEPVLEENLN